ncbi:MAG: anthrax toxin-like adenylyl cyclase domain-containing protein, partial [Cyanobacteria bacterium P01_F01_bin.53]
MFNNWKSTSHSIWRPVVNGQVIPFPPTKPDKKLAGEGFPPKVSRAFQKAADELNCVIWSRVPGKACTTLIDEGYNLKPFYVHGKSCDWGPMAGFICQLPALNKSGTSKIDYNLKEHLNSLKWLVEI